MDWKSVGAKIATIAPALGTAFGPLGTAGGLAIKALADAFGLKAEEVTPEKLEALLANDPEALLKLKEAELNFQLENKKLENESLKAQLSDVQNARQRQLEHEKTTGKTDKNLYFLAWLVVGGFFILVGFLMFRTLPAANVGPVNQLFGAMATGFGMVLQYFFGSSLGSWGKTKEISDLTKKLTGG